MITYKTLDSFPNYECYVRNPGYIGKLEVNHIDGDKLNYSLENLEWVTPSESMKHVFETKLNIISTNQRQAIKLANQKLVHWSHPEHGEYYCSSTDLSRLFSLNRECLSRVSLGKYSQHKSWKLLIKS